MPRRKTHEEFVQDIFEKVGNEYTVIGTYVNSRTKIMMRHNCDKCDNYEYPVTPSSFLTRENRCPKCANNIKKTHDQFEKEIEEIYGKDVYTFITEYINCNCQLIVKHNSCGETFPINAMTLSEKPKNSTPPCPNCNDNFKVKLTQEEVESRYEKEGYKLISKYENVHANITAICPNGHEWTHLHSNFKKGERCKHCANNTKKTLEYARSIFIKNNFTPTFTRYNNNKEPLTFICNEHPEYGEQTCRLSNLEIGLANCEVCYRNKFKGENHPNWEGGITTIANLMRSAIYNSWVMPSLAKYNFKCALSGEKRNLEVHHISKNFNFILKESLNILGLNEKRILNELSIDEENKLKLMVVKLHNEYGLGIPLRKDIHRLFHHLYGKKENTQEQFEEFKVRYYNGEFDDLLN